MCECLYIALFINEEYKTAILKNALIMFVLLGYFSVVKLSLKALTTILNSQFVVSMTSTLTPSK